MEIGKLKSGVKLEMSKVVVHEAYCYRHMLKCDICSEMIKRKEMDEHLKECDLKINCSYC